MNKVKFPFLKYNNKKIRMCWDSITSKWYFCVLDVVAALRNKSSYDKVRNYWKFLKNKLKINCKLDSVTNQLKFPASDNKNYLYDCVNWDGLKQLCLAFPTNVGGKFLAWLFNNNDHIDNVSKIRAYELYDNQIVDFIEVGTAKGLQQIHGYIFGGLYDFCGQVRNRTIMKDGYTFTIKQMLVSVLDNINHMPESNLEEIVEKYICMNIAHPFMEGNGRSTRIWLDLILKKRLNVVVDWSKIDKKEYLEAMIDSHNNSDKIYKLIKKSLTNKINDREVFIKGIDQSYFYEEN